MECEMDWEIKKRGRVTYYRKYSNELFSDLVVEEMDNGDLKIRFVGMTGALAATNELGLEMYLQAAGLCQSLAEVDFLEVHSFGAAPKGPNALVDPEGYAAEKKRIRQEYAAAYAKYWKEKMPDNGLPVRFTVYLEELPDKDASYEFGAVGLLQK
jgi:hypothetical protein